VLAVEARATLLPDTNTDIQRAPAPPGLPILFDFWAAAYQAIDD
jgi:hypothetical protein